MKLTAATLKMAHKVTINSCMLEEFGTYYYIILARYTNLLPKGIDRRMLSHTLKMAQKMTGTAKKILLSILSRVSTISNTHAQSCFFYHVTSPPPGHGMVWATDPS